MDELRRRGRGAAGEVLFQLLRPGLANGLYSRRGRSPRPSPEPAALRRPSGRSTVLSPYDKLAAQLAAAGDSARRSSLISAALSRRAHQPG